MRFWFLVRICQNILAAWNKQTHLCLHPLLLLYESCTASSRQDQQRQTDTESLLEQIMVDPIDPWSDADMKSVIFYLRANKKLDVPEAWRSILGMNK